VVDYIPQRFRWMQEWSEHFCEAINEKYMELKNMCEGCNKNYRKCIDDSDGTKCNKCKNQCKTFKIFIEHWKKQFEIQNDKYTELYKNINSSTTTQTKNMNTDKDIQDYLHKIKITCKDPNSAAPYLDKTTYCKSFKFIEDSNSGTNSSYAFTTVPPDYKEACKCKVPHPLDNCPKDDKSKDVIKQFENSTECTLNLFKNDLNEWNNYDVISKTTENDGVLVPPRRRHLCITYITYNIYKMNDENDFKKNLLHSSFSQGILLGKIYKNYTDEAYDAMRYSYADLGDIVKGTDMMSSSILNKLK
ncbi:putative EMP1-like protein, partial [Plasmodium gaboni]